MKPGAGDKQMSKAALKNQRRREAKKAAKQVCSGDFLHYLYSRDFVLELKVPYPVMYHY